MPQVLQTQVFITATKDEVFELLISEKFNKEKALATKSTVVDFIKTVNLNSTQTTLSREFIREIPEIAQSFIGEKILAEEIFKWNPLRDQAEILINIKGAPLSISGLLQLSENAPETKIEINLLIKAGVPFISERIEKFAEKIWANISSDELDLLKNHFKPQI